MKALVHTVYRKGVFTLVFLLLLFLSDKSYSQVLGDYRSVVSGPWNDANTWEIYTGGGIWAFPGAGNIPTLANTVYIKPTHTVTVTGTGPYNCKSLWVESGGKLYTNQGATNIYINIYGSLFRCDGEIGNGMTFDGISFNFEATSTSITGTGIITVSRIRKSLTANAVTNLSINTNVTLRWNNGFNTQLYNNTSGTSKFNVTIAAGATLNCVGGALGPGNVSIDGTTGTGSAGQAGTITVNGTLNVDGSIYLLTNNTITGDSCSWIINNGGILKCGSLYTGNSGAAGNFLRVMSGGKLEITGTPNNILPSFSATTVLPSVNNAYLFYPGSYCEYSGLGNQWVPAIPNSIPASAGSFSNPGYYGYLTISGSGTKTLAQSSASSYPFNVTNDFTISNAAGSPVFNCNNAIVSVSGSWINYDQSAFTEGTGQVVFRGTSLSTITCPGGEVFNRLIYTKSLGAQIRFNNNVAVNDKIEWTLNGAYDLNGNDLIIKTNTPASCSNGGNALKYIISERTDNKSRVLWRIGTLGSTTSFIIPFGKSSTGYVPFTFTVPVGVNADTIKVATYATPSTNMPWPTWPDNVTNLDGIFNPVPDNRDYTVDRFWQVNSSAVTPPSLSYVFSYLAAELPLLVSDPLTIGAQHWNTAISDWQQPVLGTGASAYSVAVNNVSYFGPWTMVGYSSPLPVSFLNFDAHIHGKNVDVLWSTASEYNNDRFEVERSRDGLTFSKIGSVDGKGTTSSTQYYKFIDTDPFQGISYYRLTQVDYDGTRSNSKIAAVQFRPGVTGNLYPQPAVDFVYWEAEDKSLTGDLEFSLYTTSGVLVQREIIQAQGAARYTLTTTGLASSIYFLVISGNGVQQQVPLLINRQ